MLNREVNKAESSWSLNCVSTGFTLLEMLLVVAIIGLTMMLTIPHMGMGQTTILKAQVREAVAILNHARRSAIIHGRPMVVTFSTSSTAPSMPGQWVSRGASLQWGGEESGDKAVTHEITFYPEGGSSGGELSILQDDYKVNITINPLTGKVETVFVDEEHA